MKKKPNEIDVIAGSNVRRLRMLQGISQEKLGDSLGLTFQQVQKYEKGTNRMGSSRLVQIAKALNCSTTALLEGTGPAVIENSINDPVREMAQNVRGIRIAALWSKMSLRKQIALVVMAEALLHSEVGPEQEEEPAQTKKRRQTKSLLMKSLVGQRKP